jgi:DnaJ domain
VAKRDPFVVLGVQPNASATQIKAAWRRLARQNHPDLTGDDPAASRLATRRMAEINDAYAALTRDDGSRRSSDDADGGGPAGFAEPTPRRGGPPRPRPTRPVTGRVDTTSTFRARDAAAGHPNRQNPLSGQPPLRGERVNGEPPRASTPTGPMVRGRLRHFRPTPPPPLALATEYPVEFGKFHGHTLGQIASFEPSYIDWLTGTVTRDPDLVAAARVVQADLDRRGVLRRARPTPERPGRSA